MRQLPGFIHPQFPFHVYKLKKALYGLQHPPRAWYHSLWAFLLFYGFINSLTETLLFVCKNITVHTYFLVYVDDLLLTGNDSSFLDKFMSALATSFFLKDLSFPSYFLDLEPLSTKTGMFLSQQGYICDLLGKVSMSGTKPMATPISTTCHFSPDSAHTNCKLY